MKLTMYLVTLEYRGTLFHGFQKQPGLPTIQGAFDSAVLTYTGQEIRTLGAGRTDAGVHALGQTATFDLDEKVDIDRALRGLNALLPQGISITDMREVAPDFDPRRRGSKSGATSLISVIDMPCGSRAFRTLSALSISTFSSRSNVAVCPRACTPASVRPAPRVRISCPV